MKRRDFIAAFGGAAAWPLAARAQQSAIPVIGFLSSSSSIVTTKRITSFSQGLSETGYVAGRDVMIEPRLAEGQYDRLPALAADLVSRRVNLIAALHHLRRLRRRKQPRQFPSFSSGPSIRSRPALSPASTGRVAMSQA